MSFPASPVLNEIFIANGKAWKFDGTNWVIPQKASTLPWELVTNKPTYFAADWGSTVANIPNYFNAKVISSEFPPTNQVTGTLWWDEVNQRLYVYQSNVWVETSVALREKFITIDPDVINYVTAVEAADGAPLEQDVVTAYEAFILGCKIDGIWNSIKASCILAGARTLAGAMVPLVGPTPTIGTLSGVPVFGPSAYNRKTGLGGSTFNNNGGGLITNRNHTEDPQNDKHISVYLTEATTGVPSSGNDISYPILSSAGVPYIITYIGINPNTQNYSANISSGTYTNTLVNHSNAGFLGITRGVKSGAGLETTSTPSTKFAFRASGATANFSSNSSTPRSGVFSLKGYNLGNASNARASFYSIGESIDLEKLDARVTKLMTTLSTVIP